VSYSQEQMLRLYVANPLMSSYHMLGLVWMGQDAAEKNMEQALDLLCRRHEVL
jgi:hypothetical protein